MKTFNQAFVAAKLKHADWRDYSRFYFVQEKYHLRGKKLKKYFKKLVDVDDYDKTELKQILSFLVTL